jgi:hypothetical protein
VLKESLKFLKIGNSCVSRERKAQSSEVELQVLQTHSWTRKVEKVKEVMQEKNLLSTKMLFITNQTLQTIQNRSTHLLMMMQQVLLKN